MLPCGVRYTGLRQVISPLLDLGCNQAQAARCFHALATSFPREGAVALRVRSQWRRFLGVVALCVRHLMPLYAFVR